MDSPEATCHRYAKQFRSGQSSPAIVKQIVLRSGKTVELKAGFSFGWQM